MIPFLEHRYIELFLHSSPSPPPTLSPSSSSFNRGPSGPPATYNDLNMRYSASGSAPQPVPPPPSSSGMMNEVSRTGMSSALGNLSLMGGVIPNYNSPIQTAIQTAIDHRLGQDGRL